MAKKITTQWLPAIICMICLAGVIWFGPNPLQAQPAGTGNYGISEPPPSGFVALADADLDMNGNDIITDPDGDSRWEHGTDDEITGFVGGTQIMQIQALGVDFDAKRICVTNGGQGTSLCGRTYIVGDDPTSYDVSYYWNGTKKWYWDHQTLGLLSMSITGTAAGGLVLANAAGAIDIGQAGTPGNVGANDAFVPNEFEVDGNTWLDGQIQTFNLEQRDANGTCTVNDFWIDTGGATVELCYCSATDTEKCAAMTAGPTD